MGKWLDINKQAIYATKGIENYKQGDNIRFTQSKDGKSTYVIFNKAENNELVLTAVQPKEGSKVYMLGVNKPLEWTKNNDSVVVKLPTELPGKYAWTLKIQSSSNSK